MRGAEVEVVLAERREADAGSAEGVDHRLAAEDAAEERPSREVAAEDEERAGVLPPPPVDDRLQPRHPAAVAVPVDDGGDLVGVRDVEDRGARRGAAAGAGDAEEEGGAGVLTDFRRPRGTPSPPPAGPRAGSSTPPRRTSAAMPRPVTRSGSAEPVSQTTSPARTTARFATTSFAEKMKLALMWTSPSRCRQRSDRQAAFAARATRPTATMRVERGSLPANGAAQRLREDEEGEEDLEDAREPGGGDLLRGAALPTAQSETP